MNEKEKCCCWRKFGKKMKLTCHIRKLHISNGGKHHDSNRIVHKYKRIIIKLKFIFAFNFTIKMLKAWTFENFLHS